MIRRLQEILTQNDQRNFSEFTKDTDGLVDSLLTPEELSQVTELVILGKGSFDLTVDSTVDKQYSAHTTSELEGKVLLRGRKLIIMLDATAQSDQNSGQTTPNIQNMTYNHGSIKIFDSVSDGSIIIGGNNSGRITQIRNISSGDGSMSLSGGSLIDPVRVIHKVNDAAQLSKLVLKLPGQKTIKLIAENISAGLTVPAEWSNSQKADYIEGVLIVEKKKKIKEKTEQKLKKLKEEKEKFEKKSAEKMKKAFDKKADKERRAKSKEQKAQQKRAEAEQARVMGKMDKARDKENDAQEAMNDARRYRNEGDSDFSTYSAEADDYMSKAQQVVADGMQEFRTKLNQWQAEIEVLQNRADQLRRA